MVEHQYWSANTWDIKTSSEKSQPWQKWEKKLTKVKKCKFTIFEELSFFTPRFYISGICGLISMFDHAKWVIFEF